MPSETASWLWVFLPIVSASLPKVTSVPWSATGPALRSRRTVESNFGWGEVEASGHARIYSFSSQASTLPLPLTSIEPRDSNTNSSFNFS